MIGATFSASVTVVVAASLENTSASINDFEAAATMLRDIAGISQNRAAPISRDSLVPGAAMRALSADSWPSKTTRLDDGPAPVADTSATDSTNLGSAHSATGAISH